MRNLNRVILYRHEFRIIKINSSYILYNSNKPFSNGHTHLQKFNSCISIIKLIERKGIPKNRSKYFIESILRVSDDRKYNEKLEDLFIDFKEMMENNNDIIIR